MTITNRLAAEGGATDSAVPSGLNVARDLSDIESDMNTLQARINSLAGGASGLGEALDGGNNGEMPGMAYSVAFIFEMLHRELGEIIQDVADLRSRMALHGGAE